MHFHVLFVDDEVELARSTLEYLAAFGISGMHAPSAEDGRRLLGEHEFDLLLLDINLPGRTGYELCREVRRDSDLPIVFVSARTADDDEVLALGVGGDDYIRKPYSLNVLLAKVRRLLERFAGADAGYDDGWLRADAATDRVWVDGAEIALTGLESRLLRYFVVNRGRVLGKAELFAEVWQDAFVGDGTLTVHVRRLRRKIERDPDDPRYIRTVWGRGYLFEPEPQ